MVYFPNVAVNLRNLPDDECAVRLEQYHNAARADEPDRARCVRNMMVATGLNFDQWANNWRLLEQMVREGRGPRSYNFAQSYIRGLAGNFVMNWFDPKLVDREDDDVEILATVEALQHAYYANKELMNYKASAIATIWNGCTYGGVEELVVDHSIDPRGIPAFESLRPDMVTFEQTTENRISRAAKIAWKRFYLSPKEMVELMPHMEKHVHDAVLAEVHEGLADQYDATVVGSFAQDLPTWGTKRLCIQEYRIEHESQDGLIHTDSGREFPDNGMEVGSEEDFMDKVMWGAANGLTVTPESIQPIRRPKPAMYTTIMCESLGVKLEARKDERQLNGHIPLYTWAFLQLYGKMIGVVDVIIDPQDDINKRANAETKLFTQTPIGGKPWIHPDAFGDNDLARQRAVEEFNDSSVPLVLDADAPPGVTLFGIMPGPAVNPSYKSDENMKIDWMNRIASLPMAMQGFTERSGESGLHLGRKVIEGSIMQRMPLEGLIQHENDKAEDWLILQLQKLRGPANYNRTFETADGSNKVMLNIYGGRNGNGEPMIRNDVSRIVPERVHFIIAQSKENDFMKQAKRETDAAILQSIRPTPTNGAAIAAFVTDLIQASDFADEEQKEKAERASNLYYDLEMAQGTVALGKAQLENIQVQKALEQVLKGGAAGGQGGAPGAPGGGPGGPGGPPGRAPPPQPGVGPPAVRAPAPPAEPMRPGEPTREAVPTGA